MFLWGIFGYHSLYNILRFAQINVPFLFPKHLLIFSGFKPTIAKDKKLLKNADFFKSRFLYLKWKISFSQKKDDYVLKMPPKKFQFNIALSWDL